MDSRPYDPRFVLPTGGRWGVHTDAVLADVLYPPIEQFSLRHILSVLFSWGVNPLRAAGSA